MWAQNDINAGSYNPHDFFTQSFNPPSGNAFRSANGTPGPMYWQNSASYLIHATLNEKDTTITGDVTISYVNNSPDRLEYLWLQLDQNLFNLKSRGVAATPAINDLMGVRAIDQGGLNILDVSVISDGKNDAVQPVITDT
ncbi:MAG TPA: M1 family peptidase, partial [Puia sp.]|nr:M1 family peptidase [Puia sp.]